MKKVFCGDGVWLAVPYMDFEERNLGCPGNFAGMSRTTKPRPGQEGSNLISSIPPNEENLINPALVQLIRMLPHLPIRMLPHLPIIGANPLLPRSSHCRLGEGC